MKWCHKCKLEHFKEGTVSSDYELNLDTKTTTVSSDTVSKKKINKILKVILFICIAYALIGIALWTISMFDTKWSIMEPRCCADCDKLWYSEYWDYYLLYTLPFIAITLPIYVIAYLIENTLISSLIIVYLPFVPLLLLWVGIKITNKLRCWLKISE